jgi:peptidoglycan/LPS O-acetylase OafA/YrhL
MGIFRYLLALMVVLWHTPVCQDHTALKLGTIAVATFFFDSGFLRPLAYEKNYGSAGGYLLNRLLRIFPVYWASLLCDRFSPRALHAPALAIDWVQNFALLGLNQSHLWGRYLRFNNPAWTLDVELQYYLLVPLFVLCWRRSFRAVLAVMAVLSALSLYLYVRPTDVPDIDNSLLGWSFFFFAGFLYQRSVAAQEWIGRQARPVVMLALLLIACWQTELMLAGLVILSAVFLKLQRDRRFGSRDAFWGELSYPVYIFHILLIRGTAWTRFQARVVEPLADGTLARFWITVAINFALSTAVAVAVYYLIVRPMERVRAGFKRRAGVDRARP